MIGFGMSEENTERILAHPLGMVCSDGGAYAPYGALSGSSPHPRGYGSASRGFWVITSAIGSQWRWRPPCTRSRGCPRGSSDWRDRGALRVGAVADVVVFDPGSVADRATFEDPHQYPVGIPARGRGGRAHDPRRGADGADGGAGGAGDRRGRAVGARGRKSPRHPGGDDVRRWTASLHAVTTPAPPRGMSLPACGRSLRGASPRSCERMDTPDVSPSARRTVAAILEGWLADQLPGVALDGDAGCSRNRDGPWPADEPDLVPASAALPDEVRIQPTSPCAVHAAQRATNPVLRRFWDAPPEWDRPPSWHEIPPVPAAAFRDIRDRVRCTPEVVFRTSGTTGGGGRPGRTSRPQPRRCIGRRPAPKLSPSPHGRWRTAAGSCP